MFFNSIQSRKMEHANKKQFRIRTRVVSFTSQYVDSDFGFWAQNFLLLSRIRICLRTIHELQMSFLLGIER